MILAPNPTILLLARLFAAAEMDYIAAVARSIESGPAILTSRRISLPGAATRGKRR